MASLVWLCLCLVWLDGAKPRSYTIYLARESEVGAESAVTEMLPLARAPVEASIVYTLIVLADWLPIRKYFPAGARIRKVGLAGALNGDLSISVSFPVVVSREYAETLVERRFAA